MVSDKKKKRKNTSTLTEECEQIGKRNEHTLSEGAELVNLHIQNENALSKRIYSENNSRGEKHKNKKQKKPVVPDESIPRVQHEDASLKRSDSADDSYDKMPKKKRKNKALVSDASIPHIIEKVGSEDDSDGEKSKKQRKKKSVVANESIPHGQNENTSLKRSDFEDDSEDEKPKKKKKKKLLAPEVSSDKKGKKSIRQMKKEKYVQRQAEAKAVAKDELKSQTLSYLSEWKHNRTQWKFMKAKQVWLYKNKFSSYLVPDTAWAMLLEYFESAQGNIRKLLLADANKIINQMDEWTEKHGSKNHEDLTEDLDDNKPDDTSYKRARDLIQCLEE